MTETQPTTAEPTTLPRKSPSRRYTPALLIALLGLVISLVAFRQGREWESKAILAEFYQEAGNRVTAFKREMHSSGLILEAIDGFYASSTEVERDEFRSFVQPLLTSSHCVQALEWVPFVPDSERARVETAARQDGFPGFQITERGAQSQMVPATRRDDYFPVYFVEPRKGNEPALGFDLGSTPIRRRAIEKARDTGNLTATPRVTLVQEKGNQFGFLLLKPVYRRDMPTDSVENRRKAFQGLVVGVFRISDLLEGALSNFQLQDFDIGLYDLSAPEEARLLWVRGADDRSTFVSDSAASETGLPESLHYAEAITVADRQWLLTCVPAPDYVSARRTWQPWYVLGALALVTTVLTIYVLSVLGRSARSRAFADEMLAAKQRLEREAAERTIAEQALRESEGKLDALLQSNPDSMIVLDPDMNVVWANESTKRNFGENAVGRKCYEVFHGRTEPCLPTPCLVSKTFQDGQPHEQDNRIATESGEVLHFHCTANVTLRDAQGNPEAVIEILRDVTEQKRTEDALRESQRRLGAMLDNIPDMAWMKDKEGRYIAANEAFGKACGHPPADLPGRTDLELWPRDLAESYIADDLEVMRSGQRKCIEEPLETPDGLRIWIETFKTPFFNDHGQVLGIVGIARDITARKETQQQLQESEVRLRTLLNSVQAGVVIVDPKTHIITDANKAALALLERTPEQVIGASCRGLLCDAAPGQCPVQDLGQATHTHECTLVHPDGKRIEIMKSVSKVMLNDWEYMLETLIDITDRKRAEEQLRKSQKRFQDVAMSSADFIWEVGADGKYALALGKTRQILGYEPEEIIGRFPFDLMPEDDAKRVSKIFARLAAEKKPIVDIENWNIAKDGRKVLLLTNGVPILDESGNLCGYRGTDRDITERKKAEEELRHSYEIEEALNALLELSVTDLSLKGMLEKSIAIITSVAAFELERKGAIFLVQKDGRELFLTAQQGLNPALLKMCSSVPFGECLCGRAASTKTLIFEAHLNQDHDYHYDGISDHGHYCIPALSTAGEVIGVINLYVKAGHLRDPHEEHFLNAVANVVAGIVERKQAEEAVIRARNEAEARAQEFAKLNRKLKRAATEKNEFLRAVSHDLSAPLRNISGMVAFLKSRYGDQLDDVGQDRVERILRNIKVQNELINDLLDLSRIKSRRGKIELTDIDQMLHSVVEQFAFDLEKKSGMVEVSGKLPAVWCETNRMRQVFQNLVDNAIKYAHPDRPARIRVACADLEDHYRFTISDNGIGMRPEDAEKAFFVFQRARNAFTAQVEGKGVGLASVKSILENYDGEIWVESEEGKGSTFTFTLPKTTVTQPLSQDEHAGEGDVRDPVLETEDRERPVPTSQVPIQKGRDDGSTEE